MYRLAFALAVSAALTLFCGCGSDLRVDENPPAQTIPGEQGPPWTDVEDPAGSASDSQPEEPSANQEVTQWDGLWRFDGTFDPGQVLIGEHYFLLAVLDNRPDCYFTFYEPITQEPWPSRPVTVDHGILATSFTINFRPTSEFGEFPVFDGESRIQVTIVGTSIAPNVYDAFVVLRFLFTEVTLTMTGTLEWFDVSSNPCSPR